MVKNGYWTVTKYTSCGVVMNKGAYDSERLTTLTDNFQVELLI